MWRIFNSIKRWVFVFWVTFQLREKKKYVDILKLWQYQTDELLLPLHCYSDIITHVKEKRKINNELFTSIDWILDEKLINNESFINEIPNQQLINNEKWFTA